MSSMTKLNQSKAGKAFDVFNFLFFIVLSVVMMIPIAYVFVGSFSSSGLAQLKFGSFTLDAYDVIIHSKRTMTSLLNSVILTAGGTLISITFTTMTAYGPPSDCPPAFRGVCPPFGCLSAFGASVCGKLLRGILRDTHLAKISAHPIRPRKKFAKKGTPRRQACTIKTGCLSF